MCSFFPNQEVLIRTMTGLFLCCTEDKYMGYYSYGLDNNIYNANRGAILKYDKDLYFLNTHGEVVYYDIDEILDRLKFKSETWGIKNMQKRTFKFAQDCKDICDGPGDLLYALTSDGTIYNCPTKGRTERYPDINIAHELKGDKIYFTTIAATGDFVCVAGYMPDNQHNSIQLVRANLASTLDGPIRTHAVSGHVHNLIGFKRKGINYFVASCYYQEVFMYAVLNGKFSECLRMVMDGPSATKANHGLCFEYGDQDNFEKLIVFGQGYARILQLKYD